VSAPPVALRSVLRAAKVSGVLPGVTRAALDAAPEDTRAAVQLAASAGLDDSVPARMARAAVSHPFSGWRGSVYDGMDRQARSGVRFLSSDPRVADTYTEAPLGDSWFMDRWAPHVGQFRFRMPGAYHVQMGGASWHAIQPETLEASGVPLPDIDRVVAAVGGRKSFSTDALAAALPGRPLIFHDMIDTNTPKVELPSTVYVVPDKPGAIRSVYAMFDPERVRERGLHLGLGGVVGGGALAATRRERDRRRV